MASLDVMSQVTLIPPGLINHGGNGGDNKEKIAYSWRIG